MNQDEPVGMSDWSRRKIYHMIVKGKETYCPTYAICAPALSLAFLDKLMPVREAEKKGYRLCLKCKRKMERKK